jgi:exosortase
MTNPRVVAAWIVPTLLWLWLFVHLHDGWSLNPQYNYGWAVPFLAALLFYLRWIDRPRPAAKRDEGFFSTVRLGRWVLLAILLPIRVVEEANPDWRLLGWALAMIVVAYCLLLLQEVGGRPWSVHFAFPICFVLVSVPWLVQIENVIVQNLARGVAAVAVEFAGWVGIGAYQLGNVIELPNGFVGIDEACSGVKTLQAALMVGLFLGELLRLSVQRRLLLVVLGVVWVVLCNIFRATTLVVLAARYGLDALGHWHDLIGTIVVIAGMAGLLACALFLNLKSGQRVLMPQDGQTQNISIAETVSVIGWLLVVFTATEFWYRAHERGLLERPRWSVHWPTHNIQSQRIAISDATRAILRYDEASSATWEESPAVKWWGFSAHWKPRRVAVQLAQSHSPEICLPAIGRVFKRELPPVTIYEKIVDLHFRAYEFEQEDRPLFVFVSIQDDKASFNQNMAAANWNTRGRLLAAWQGRRNLGQRLLELAVKGFDDFSQAHDALRKTVETIVEPLTD